MLLLSSFYGLILTMNFQDHNPPHFHARYAEFKATFDFDGNMTTGSMPEKKQALIRAWCILHKEELEANWVLSKENEAVIRIDPLK
jgi:hypothetical protein